MDWCEKCRKDQPFILVEEFPKQKGRTPPTPQEPEGVEYLYKGAAYGCPCSHSSPDSSQSSEALRSASGIHRQY